MGEVEAAAPGEQELARRTRARVVDDDAPAGQRNPLGGHQPCRAGAGDDAKPFSRLRPHLSFGSNGINLL